MSPLMCFFLLCAVAGAVLPWYFNLQQLLYGSEAFNMTNFFRAGLANNFTASMTADFMITTVAVLVWMVVESRRLHMSGIIVYVVLSIVISIAFTCPLFLFHRERQLLSRAASKRS